jgi:hypothetical protein
MHEVSVEEEAGLMTGVAARSPCPEHTPSWQLTALTSFLGIEPGLRRAC